MHIFRQYLEVTDADEPFTAEIRLCHDFPAIPFTNENQVIVFDERVASEMAGEKGIWSARDMPTGTWSVLAV